MEAMRSLRKTSKPPSPAAENVNPKPWQSKLRSGVAQEQLVRPSATSGVRKPPSVDVPSSDFLPKGMSYYGDCSLMV